MNVNYTSLFSVTAVQFEAQHLQQFPPLLHVQVDVVVIVVVAASSATSVINYPTVPSSQKETTFFSSVTCRRRHLPPVTPK